MLEIKTKLIAFITGNDFIEQLLLLFVAEIAAGFACQASCTLCEVAGAGKCDGVQYCDPTVYGGVYDSATMTCQSKFEKVNYSIQGPVT